MHHKISLLIITLLLFVSSCRKDDIVVTKKDYKTLGTSANGFLSANNYSTLNIEISYMNGYAPEAAVIENLKSFLNTHLNKPGGIYITQKQISATVTPTIAIGEIANLERTHRTLFTAGNTLAAHVLVIDAEYDKERVLGISYWNTSIAILGKTLYKSATGLSRTNLYSTLLKHEFAHLLGLLNKGTPMLTSHEDAANPGHCSNKNCLMYYAIETGGLISGNTGTLDANCVADLKANGGK